jgi:hypothetical protein
MRGPNASGYSATPLARKLGIKPFSRVALVDAPKGYTALLEPLPEGVVFERGANARSDTVQIFVRAKEDLARQLAVLRGKLRPEAAVWVSWPKKTANVPTTVSENAIREVALPLGFVDIKVCAVDELWSGLKLVVRRELREHGTGKPHRANRRPNRSSKPSSDSMSAVIRDGKVTE